MISPSGLQKTVTTDGYCIEPAGTGATSSATAIAIAIVSFSECIPGILRVTALAAGGTFTFSSSDNVAALTTVTSAAAEVGGAGGQLGTLIQFTVANANLVKVGQTFEIRDVDDANAVICYGAFESTDIPANRVRANVRFQGAKTIADIDALDTIFNIVPTTTVGFPLGTGANASVTVASPNWAQYILFKREAATDATVILTKVG